MTASDRSARQSTADHAGREARIEAVTRDLIADAPPVAKYKYTLVIRGNSHQEIQSELLTQVNGGYLLDSDYESRDSFDVYGGRERSTLEHANPEMTPEKYDQDLREWRDARRIARAADVEVGGRDV